MCVGDIVLVRREGGLCAHRVVAVVGTSENPRWMTQGDALPAPDNRPVEPNELLGRIAYVIRRGKLIELSADLSAAEESDRQGCSPFRSCSARLIYLNRLLQTPEKPVLPCQGSHTNRVLQRGNHHRRHRREGEYYGPRFSEDPAKPLCRFHKHQYSRRIRIGCRVESACEHESRRRCPRDSRFRTMVAGARGFSRRVGTS